MRLHSSRNCSSLSCSVLLYSWISRINGALHKKNKKHCRCRCCFLYHSVFPFIRLFAIQIYLSFQLYLSTYAITHLFLCQSFTVPVSFSLHQFTSIYLFMIFFPFLPFYQFIFFTPFYLPLEISIWIYLHTFLFHLYAPSCLNFSLSFYIYVWVGSVVKCLGL